MLVEGLALGLAEGVKPGPLNTLVVSETLQHDWKAGAKVAASPLITDAPIISISAALWWTAASIDALSIALSLIGGLYLIWLAIDGFRTSGFKVSEEKSAKTDSLRRGVITNFLNPNAWLFWTLAGAPFLVEAYKVAPSHTFLFIGGFLGMLIGVKIGIAIAVSRSKAFLSGRGIAWAIRLCSLALLWLAARLILPLFWSVGG